MPKSFTMSLSDEMHVELEQLCSTYNKAQKLNRLNVQDLIRLILKSHLQALRGPTKQEELRMKQFSAVEVVPGMCPQCLLRVDKHDFPVLSKIKGKVVCSVCGHSETIWGE